MNIEHVVATPTALLTERGETIALDERTLAGALRRAATIRERFVLWVHEDAHAAFGLGASRTDELGLSLPDAAWSSEGWARVPFALAHGREAHLAFPAWSGDFAETTTPAELLRALRLFRELVGIDFLYSAPSTVLRLVDVTRLERPSESAGVDYVASAFAVPAYVWSRPVLASEGRYARVYDRRGSYLAAWRSVELPDGEWTTSASATLGTILGSPGRFRPGYYLVDLAPLAPYLAGIALLDPFVRHGRPSSAGGAPTWLTAPLALLAAELADEAGVELRVAHAVIAERTVRALDKPAERLADARRALDGALDDPVPGTIHEGNAAAAVRAMVNDGYRRGTAHLEFGKRPPHPLARPEWRHTIVERHVANTYRALHAAQVRPFLVGAVDAAVFALPRAREHPPGLRMDANLGSWQPRGRAVTSASLRAALRASPPRDVLFALLNGSA